MTEPIKIDPRFYRVAAVCSFLSVASTLGLIFLPDLFSSGSGFEARMGRVHELPYLVRAWTYLLHPFLVYIAALGIAFSVWHRAPVLAIGGMVGFTMWAFNEAGQQTLTLFAFDRWRVAWETADEATRAALRVNIAMYDGLWDGMYMLLLMGFAIGNACLGAALVASPGLSRWVGGFALAGCALTVMLFIGEVGLQVAPPSVLEWAYPLIQPLGRALIGVWLWRCAANRMTDLSRG